MSAVMRFTREGYPVILAVGGLTVLVGMLGLREMAWAGLILTLAAAAFFRDPERTVPPGENLVVSPADGKVVAVERETTEERYLRSPVSRISIFMSLWDVHVNRVPLAGKVVEVHYQQGKFHPAFSSRAPAVNERNAIVMVDPQGQKMLLVQIAGTLARRIICYVKGGQEVEKGQRCGMIILGSRVDMYLPLVVTLRVKPGDRVRGGETIIGEYRV